MTRDYARDILAAHKAGDADALAAIALELAQRAAVAEELERRESERKAHHAEWKRENRRTRQQTSMDVHGQSRTSVDTMDTGSPPVPPSPLPAPNSPPPFNPPSHVPRPAGRKADRPPVTGSRRASWLEPAAASWEAKFGAGSFPWGEGGKALKPLHAANHPPDEIARRLAKYLATTEARFVSLSRFAKTFGEFAPLRFTEPPIDRDGCMSAEFERMTRPPGVYAA